MTQCKIRVNLGFMEPCKRERQGKVDDIWTDRLDLYKPINAEYSCFWSMGEVRRVLLVPIERSALGLKVKCYRDIKPSLSEQSIT